MSNVTVALSEDGYLLQKFVSKTSINRIVDHAHVDLKIKNKPDREMVHDLSNQKSLDEYGVRKLYEYSEPKENDIVVYYNDIGVLCGSAGYILLRNGYVHNVYTMWRS